MELWQWHCRNRREKKLLETNCGNTIAEIGKKKFFFVAIMAMHCRNRGRKKNRGYQNLGRN